MHHINWSYCMHNHISWSYFNTENYIFPPFFNTLSLNICLLLLILWALLVSVCLQFILERNLSYVSILKWFLRWMAGCLIVVMICQVCWQQQFWFAQMHKIVSNNGWQVIRNKNQGAKFTDFILSHTSNDMSCSFISQDNIRFIIYTLYPRIIVQERNNKLNDFVAVFNLKDPLKHLPAGFNKVMWYDSKSLIAFKSSR